jgi:hypothetical protein
MRTAFTAIFLAVLAVLGAVVSPWMAAATDCPSRAVAFMAMGLRGGADCGTSLGASCGDSCGHITPSRLVTSPGCCPGDAVCATADVGSLGAGESGRAACGEGSNALPGRGCQRCRASAISALSAIEGTTRSRATSDTAQEPARVVAAAHIPATRCRHADMGQSVRVLDNSRRQALLCVRTI